MMVAIVSDIHANIEALTTVMKDIDQQGIDEVVCLGDVVGYGPDPIPCVEIAQKFFRWTLMGNHDQALFNGATGFNPRAKGAIAAHLELLQPAWYSKREKKEHWNFLKRMPLRYMEEGYLFVHAAPQNPTEEYLLPSDVDAVLGDFSPKLKRAFEEVTSACFVGHTHHPGIFVEGQKKFIAQRELGDERYRLDPDEHYIINVGSVGQPRDGDPRAGYCIVEDGQVLLKRIAYDLQATKKKIHENPRLDNELGDRLEKGV